MAITTLLDTDVIARINDGVVAEGLRDSARSAYWQIREAAEIHQAQAANAYWAVQDAEFNTTAVDLNIATSPTVQDGKRAEQFYVEMSKTGNADFITAGNMGFVVKGDYMRWQDKLVLNCRNELGKAASKRAFEDYAAGHAFILASGSSATFTLDTVNGFERAYDSKTGRYDVVSASNKLDVFLWDGSAWTDEKIVACDTAAKTITFDGSVTVAADRTPIKSMHASKVVYSKAGARSIDDIGSTDVNVYDALMEAKNHLQYNNLMGPMGGQYVCYCDAEFPTILAKDTRVLNAFTSMPAVGMYAPAGLQSFAGITFVPMNAPGRTAVSTNIITTNGNSQRIGYALLVAEGALQEERPVFLSRDVTVDLVGDGIHMVLDGAEVDIHVDPTDTMRKKLVGAWTWYGSFVCPTNILAGNAFGFDEDVSTANAARKNAILIAYAR